MSGKPRESELLSSVSMLSEKLTVMPWAEHTYTPLSANSGSCRVSMPAGPERGHCIVYSLA